MKLTSLLCESKWLEQLSAEFKKPYMQNIEEFLNSELSKGKRIYPGEENIFNALNLTPLNKIKVVILGQDPYHGEGQAHGLSFSVQKGVSIPPSLKNIYKELESDLSITIPDHGYLRSWSEQGVFLINSTLTVEEKKAGSHQKIGWEILTDHIIKIINRERKSVVYLLWGSHARKKRSLIDENSNLILEAPHPSPLSAYRGFLGCKHFSKANAYLKKTGHTSIDWQIPIS